MCQPVLLGAGDRVEQIELNKHGLLLESSQYGK